MSLTPTTAPEEFMPEAKELPAPCSVPRSCGAADPAGHKVAWLTEPPAGFE